MIIRVEHFWKMFNFDMPFKIIRILGLDKDLEKCRYTWSDLTKYICVDDFPVQFKDLEKKWSLKELIDCNLYPYVYELYDNGLLNNVRLQITPELIAEVCKKTRIKRDELVNIILFGNFIDDRIYNNLLTYLKIPKDFFMENVLIKKLIRLSYKRFYNAMYQIISESFKNLKGEIK